MLGLHRPERRPATGATLARRYLRYLAHHPSTARRIARRLAVRFVSDHPSAALVTAVADAFTASGTDIKATLRALVAHPEFAASAGEKIKTPTEDGVATVPCARRAAGPAGRPGVRRQRDRRSSSALMGQMPFDWPRPDGFPDVAEAWTSASRMLGSWHVHWALAGGYWPKEGATYRSVKSWLPPLPARFDEVVDHIAAAADRTPGDGAR